MVVNSKNLNNLFALMNKLYNHKLIFKVLESGSDIENTIS